VFTLTCAAYNLVRLRNLVGAARHDTGFQGVVCPKRPSGPPEGRESGCTGVVSTLIDTIGSDF
jgi:hypothetical protein